ncbi:MAG: hypothetical protein WCG27_06065 [Pseudomonadota bacterium]
MKTGIILIFGLFSILLFSCSSSSRKEQNAIIPGDKEKIYYDLTDSSGKFILLRELGLKKNSHEIVVKRKIYDPVQGEASPLEKSISISTIGMLKKKNRILRPKISQYSVWFEGKEFFTEMKINVEKKAMDLNFRSPEAQWNGTKQVPFPQGGSVFCFYSQVIECAKVTGFITQAIQKKTGKMHFHLIWDGYPYFQEQYSNIPNELFTHSTLEYDGSPEDEKQNHRFVLDIGNQTMFYVVDTQGNFLKMFWVAQGLSILTKDRGKKQIAPKENEESNPTDDNKGGKLNRRSNPT